MARPCTLIEVLALATIAAYGTTAWAESPPVPKDSREPPELAGLVGRTIWYAPHYGCLGSLYHRQKNKLPEHSYPEAPVQVQLLSLLGTKEDGYEFAIRTSAGFIGEVGATGVIEALNRPAESVNGFYKTCFFSENPNIVGATIRHVDESLFDRLKGGPSGKSREDEIKRQIQLETYQLEAHQEVMKLRKHQDMPGTRIGMTKEQVLNQTSWGRPTHVNTTTTANTVQEQWVYGDGQYLYFTNGILTAIQN